MVPRARAKHSGQTKAQSRKAPGGASRCRVLASGISLYRYGSRSAARSGLLVAELWACRQENGGGVKANRAFRGPWRGENSLSASPPGSIGTDSGGATVEAWIP